MVCMLKKKRDSVNSRRVLRAVGVILLLVVFLVSMLYLAEIAGKYIHARMSATGEINFTLWPNSAPYITINSPISTVYKVDWFDINVTTNDAAYCMYHFNGEGNRTLNATDNGINRTFQEHNSSIGEGVYNLLIYCNNSVGSRTSTVMFAVTLNESGTGGGTTTTVIVEGGGGGGGGGGGKRIGEKEIVQEKISPGKIFSQTAVRLRAPVSGKEEILYPLKASNPYDMSLIYVLAVTNDLIMRVTPAVFELQPNKTNDLAIIFTEPNKLGVGVHLGKIVTYSSLFETELLVSYEVIDYDAPISFEVAVSSKLVNPGDILYFDVLPSYVEEGKVVSDVRYYLKDFDGRIIVEVFDKDVLLEEGVIFTKSIKLPDDILFGEYVLVVETSVGGVIISGSDFVRVGAEVFSGYALILLVLLGFGALVLLYEWRQHQLRRIIYHQHGLMREVHSKLKKGEFHYLDALAEVEKLRWQKHLLDQALSKGFIKRGVYQSQKNSVDSAIRSLRKRYLR